MNPASDAGQERAFVPGLCVVAATRCGHPTKGTGRPCRRHRARWWWRAIVLWSCQAHMDPDDVRVLKQAEADYRKSLPPGWEERLPVPPAACQGERPILSISRCRHCAPDRLKG